MITNCVKQLVTHFYINEVILGITNIWLMMMNAISLAKKVDDNLQIEVRNLVKILAVVMQILTRSGGNK